MNITANVCQDFAIIDLHGDLGAEHGSKLLRVVQGALASQVCFVIVNLRLVKFINSTALSALIKAGQLCEAKGGDLLIATPSTSVCNILRVLGISQILPVFADEISARKHAIKRLNAIELSSSPPVRHETVLITFPDADRSRRLGDRKGLLGTMLSVDSARIRFRVNGPHQGFDGDRLERLLPRGSDIHLDFHVKMLKKGFFDVTARVEDFEPMADGCIQWTASFTEIAESEREALAQFVADLTVLEQLHH